MHLNQGDFSKRRCIAENLCISYALVFENRDAFHESTQSGINLNPIKRPNPIQGSDPYSFFVLSAAKTGLSPVRYRIVHLAVRKANAAGLKDAHLFDGYELEAGIDEGRDDALGGFGR